MATQSPMRLASETTAKALPRKIKFTVTALARIKCPPGRDRAIVYDATTATLAFCVTAKGAKAFYLVRRVLGRPNRIRIGGPEMTIEQARKAAAIMNGEIAKGENPVELRRARRKVATLGALWQDYQTNHLKPNCSKRTDVSDESRYETCLAGWAGRNLLSITESEVQALHAKLARERGHVTANRAVQLLRRMYFYAKLKDHYNPAFKAVTMFDEPKRKRFVQSNELPKLFAALNAEETNPLIRDFIYLALYTGARRSNVLAMRDSEIDLTTQTWTIPAEKSKNGDALTIPLCEPALKIIERRMGHPSGFILPSHGKSGHLEEPKATWVDVLSRAGLSDIRIHDLRRTFGSFQAGLNASLPIIGRSLGHKSTGATAIYARVDLEPVRASVTAAVNAIIAAGAAK